MLPFDRRLASLLLGALLLAAAIPPASAQDAKLRPITLFMYSVAPDLGDAPLRIVPHALGYFAEEDLQVRAEYAGGSSGALQLLAAGQGQFATSTPTQVMLATHQGLKIKAVFEHNRTYGSALVVPTTAGVKSIDQLRAHLKGSISASPVCRAAASPTRALGFANSACRRTPKSSWLQSGWARKLPPP
jgi:hypothetical protein